MLEIKYFFEDWWKVIVGVLGIGIAVLVLSDVTGGNNDTVDGTDGPREPINDYGIITDDNYNPNTDAPVIEDRETLQDRFTDNSGDTALTVDEETGRVTLIPEEIKEIQEERAEQLATVERTTSTTSLDILTAWEHYNNYLDTEFKCQSTGQMFTDCLYITLKDIDTAVRDLDYREESSHVTLNNHMVPLTQAIHQHSEFVAQLEAARENMTITNPDILALTDEMIEAVVLKDKLYQLMPGTIARYTEYHEADDRYFDTTVFQSLASEVHLLQIDVEIVEDFINTYYGEWRRLVEDNSEN